MVYIRTIQARTSVTTCGSAEMDATRLPQSMDALDQALWWMLENPERINNRGRMDQLLTCGALALHVALTRSGSAYGVVAR